jgi:hypothetical protein
MSAVLIDLSSVVRSAPRRDSNVATNTLGPDPATSPRWRSASPE